MRRAVTEAELDAIGAEPRIGEVWWCLGETLGLGDGGKTRPGLVVRIKGDRVTVVPLTTQKPQKSPVSVAHRGGLSWLTHRKVELPRTSVLSSLGEWGGYVAWSRKR